MALPQLTEILIVGAGPTGLALALSLHKEGWHDMIVVDALERGENTSRALAIHAATLEMLDLLGCAEPLVKAGACHHAIKSFNGTKLLTMANFDSLKGKTKYPFALLVPQTETESVLGARVQELGISVYRPFKVVGLHPYRQDPNYTEVLFEDGQVVRARYVIGADGAKSTVRQSVGVAYKHPKDHEEFLQGELNQSVLGDVTFSQSLGPRAEAPLFILSRDNVFMTIPLPDSKEHGLHRYRIVTVVPKGEAIPPPSPPKSYLQEFFDKFASKTLIGYRGGPDEAQIAKLIWSSRYRARSSIADTFFTHLEGGSGSVVLFIGDAAHTHPPAGGQGMNLGLRDAIFLGPILAAHAGATSSASTSQTRLSEVDEPLRAWADHRRQQGLKIIDLTETIIRILGLPRRYPWIWGVLPVPIKLATLRNWGLWFLGHSKWAQSSIAWKLSGLGNK